MKDKRIAIIGLGNWGKKVLSNFDKVSDVVYCCTTGKKSNIDWLEYNYKNIFHTSDYNVILEDESIDAIIIATPIFTHFNLAKQALQAKKHVFLEKPPSTNSLEVNDLITLSKKNNKILFVDHVFYYHQNYLLLSDLVKSKIIKSIDIKWNKLGSFNENIYWNLLYHDLYLIINLLGLCEIKNIAKKVDKPNKILIKLTTSNNININIDINRLAILKKKIFSVSTKNDKYIWNKDVLFNIKHNNRTVLNTSNVQPLSATINDFLNRIETLNSKENNNLAYETVKLIEEIIKAS